MHPVRHEHQRGDRALRRDHRQPGRAVAVAQHFAPPDHARLELDLIGRDAKGQPTAAGRRRLQRQRERRLGRRAAAHRRLVAEAALKARQIGLPHLGKVNARVPHQRAVAEQPQVLRRVQVAQHRAAGVFELLVRLAPGRRQAVVLRPRIPARERVGGHPHGRQLGRRQAMAQRGQVAEGIERRGHRNDQGRRVGKSRRAGLAAGWLRAKAWLT